MKKGEVKNMDLSGQNVLTMRDVQSALAAGATQVRVCEKCVITPSARDFLRQMSPSGQRGPHPKRLSRDGVEWRFDVLAVYYDHGYSQPSFELFQNAFPVSYNHKFANSRFGNSD